VILSATRHVKHLRFVTLAYRIRILGCVLGALPVVSVLYEQHASPWLWGLMLFNGFLWPHVAYAISSRSRDPIRTESAILLADTGLIGAWLALMQFNLLPSAVLVAMVLMNHVSATGWRQATRSMLTLTLVCVAVWCLLGRPFRPVSDMLNIEACLPLLMINPVWLSKVNFSLTQRVRKQNRLLDKLNRTDVLTGLPNRTHWLEAADKALLRYQQDQRPATLILLDIDNFKQINDGNGHAAGDARLRQLATVLRQNMRPMDTPGRLGGDEFGVVVSDTGVAGGLALAERIRTQIEQMHSDDTGRQCAWTVSLGVAELADGIVDIAQWVHAADIALYCAKSSGRNRARVSRLHSPAAY
jgi:diguanylate cyclase